MQIGLVVPGSLEETSGGYRYDRKLLETLREEGDDVEVISVPRVGRSEQSSKAIHRRLRTKLDQPFDVLLQDELAYGLLSRVNPLLSAPATIITLVHLLERSTADGDEAESDRELTYLRSVDAAICTSQNTQRRLNQSVSVPSIVAYPGGGVGGAAVSSTTVATAANRDPFHIVFVGSLEPRKDPVTLVHALAELDGRWTATLVGRDDVAPAYVDIVDAEIATRGLDDRITIAGTVSDTRLETLLERAHVLAVPSRYEPFGMVYLEAMEYGTVPIASSVGGAAEFVVDGTNGLLVEPGDLEGLREALHTLQTDRDRLESLARRGLAVADAHPTWSESMDHVREFLARIVEKRETDSGGGPDHDETTPEDRS